MSINSKMTALADEVRELSGTTSPKGIDVMISDVEAANIEIANQEDLIYLISSAVNDLPEAGGGGGTSDPVLQTKTVTPTTQKQTVAPDNGYDGLSEVTVNAIPSTFIQPASTKAATTYTPTTSNQTIAAGTYCSGVQTIKGDANLVPANIVSGKTIFGVTGTATTGGGGGSSSQTATCTIEFEMPGLVQDNLLSYVSTAGLQTIDIQPGSFECVIPSIISVTGGEGGSYPAPGPDYVQKSGDIIQVTRNTFYITGDASLMYLM